MKNFARHIRNSMHNKQNRYINKDKRVNASNMEEGVPVVIGTDTGVASYVKHNGIVYKQDYYPDESSGRSTASGIGSLHFGMYSGEEEPNDANYWYSLARYMTMNDSGDVTFGNSTDPATSLAISSNAQRNAMRFWYVPFNIEVLGCTLAFSPDTSASETLYFKVMSYDIAVDNAGGTGGNLSNGKLVLSSQNTGLATVGYEDVSIYTSFDKTNAIGFNKYSASGSLKSKFVIANKALVPMIKTSFTGGMSINLDIYYKAVGPFGGSI